MKETILNIYLVIEKNDVVAFKAVNYEMEGSDEKKINFLKQNAHTDYNKAIAFNSPQNNKGEFITYKKFSKLEKQGMQYQLFEEIFEKYRVPQNPLVCVTPVVDGEIIGQK